MADIAVENGIVDGPFGSNLKTSDYIEDKENGVPVLTTKNLHGDYSAGSVRYVSKEKYETLKRSTVYPGDILVAKIGSIGTCSIYPSYCKKALIPANLLKITVKDDICRDYVFRYIQYAGFQEMLKKISTATAQPAFNVTKFRRLSIPLPSYEEQIRIVSKIEELLSELDAGVETMQKTKEQLVIYRQAVLKDVIEQLHGKKTTLGEVVVSKPRNGYSPKGVSYVTPYKNLTLTATSGGVFKENCFKYVELDINEDSYLWVKHNDILIQRANTIEYVGISAIYTGTDNRYVYPDLMMKFHVKDGINPHFILYQLKYSHARGYYRKNATGTAGSMPKINQATVMNTPIIMTSKYNQDRIVKELDSKFSICEDIDKMINMVIEQAKALKQSVLKKAFEGGL